jgi:uncharacterized protein (TIGR02996 family)
VTQDEGLFRTILAQPADDAPRLVYADWLEEHGQPERAEFIRLQCELARTPEGTERQGQLQQRRWQLQDRWRNTWLAGLPRWATRHAIFERGFVGDVQAIAADFLREGALLVQRAPIRCLRLTNFTEHIPELAACPLLDRLSELQLQCRKLDLATAEALAASPLLERVTGITSKGSERVELPPLRVLLDSPRLICLNTLALRFYARVGDEAARLIAASPRVTTLKWLELFRSGVTDAGARALAESLYLADLDSLHLYGNRYGPEGEAALRQRFGKRLW